MRVELGQQQLPQRLVVAHFLQHHHLRSLAPVVTRDPALLLEVKQRKQREAEANVVARHGRTSAVAIIRFVVLRHIQQRPLTRAAGRRRRST
eukprot:6956315-Prymnesium_polylepis.1